MKNRIAPIFARNKRPSTRGSVPRGTSSGGERNEAKLNRKEKREEGKEEERRDGGEEGINVAEDSEGSTRGWSAAAVVPTASPSTSCSRVAAACFDTDGCESHRKGAKG